MSQQAFKGVRAEQNHWKHSSSTILHFVNIEACFTILVFEKEDKILYIKALFLSSPEKVARMYLNLQTDETKNIRYTSIQQEKFIVPSQKFPATTIPKYHLEACYILFCLNVMLHFNPLHELLDKIKFIEYFTLILSLFPEQHVILNFKLHNKTHLSLVMSNKLNFSNNFIWNKHHMKIVERFKKWRNTSSVECFTRKRINVTKCKKNRKFNTTPTYYTRSPQEILTDLQIRGSHSTETNTEVTIDNSILEVIKNIKVPLRIINSSLWKASLCGEPVWTKLDFSSYILKCSCFDEVLNLNPASKYLQDWIAPLKSAIFLKKILKDLGKTFLSTMFPCPF